MITDTGDGPEEGGAGPTPPENWALMCRTRWQDLDSDARRYPLDQFLEMVLYHLTWEITERVAAGEHREWHVGWSAQDAIVTRYQDIFMLYYAERIAPLVPRQPRYR